MPERQQREEDENTMFYVDLSGMESGDHTDLLYRLEQLGMKFVLGEGDTLRMVKPDDEDKAMQVQELFQSYTLQVETKRERIGEL